MLDAYYNAGMCNYYICLLALKLIPPLLGYFIDTGNNYQEEETEAIIGEWAKYRGICDQLVIATKYIANYKRGDDITIKMNYAGNSLKTLQLSVEASLKKLRKPV